MPNDRKICKTAEVLCHSYSIGQIDDDVPPAPRDEHSFAPLLQDLKRFKLLRPIRGLGFRVYHIKPSDGFICLFATVCGLHANHFPWNRCGEETPSLVADYQRIPGTCAQW